MRLITGPARRWRPRPAQLASAPASWVIHPRTTESVVAQDSCRAASASFASSFRTAKNAGDLTDEQSIGCQGLERGHRSTFGLGRANDRNDRELSVEEYYDQ